jgi:peptide-methionine (S)-S-oxide reductase
VPEHEESFSMNFRFLIVPAIVSFASMNVSAEESKNSHASAVFGGGCFWCVEAVFENVPGVSAVTSGYAGGKTPNPTYEEVSSGRSGHAEVVKIDYDPSMVTYEELLALFWKAHDPTTLNRQGADVGTQYRSVILVANDSEREAAEASKTAAQSDFHDPIVTEITTLDAFYPAENYHQDFNRNNPGHPYVRAVIAPKLKKLF